MKWSLSQTGYEVGLPIPMVTDSSPWTVQMTGSVPLMDEIPEITPAQTSTSGGDLMGRLLASMEHQPISQIRERLEARAGAASGTREYWDCVAALLDVAEAVHEAACVECVPSGVCGRSLKKRANGQIEASRIPEQCPYGRLRLAVQKLPQVV
jgi:hypothetical protein